MSKCLWAGCAAFAFAAYGQNIGASLSGVVEDQQSSVIQKAMIEVLSAQTGWLHRLETSSQGTFRVPVVPAGVYRVRVTRDGFSPGVVEDVRLSPGEVKTLRIVLFPASVTESVVVTGDAAAVIQQDSSDRANTLSSSLMNDLPMLGGGVGRNFRTQVYIAPGVTPATQAHRPFAVSGTRSRNNNYMIDSNDFNEIEGGLLMGRGASEQLLSTEAIDGMQVLTHNFKAEYGRQNGSIVSIVTKRGTNDFHGLAYEFLRNDKLDARNTFDLARPPLRSHQFGYNLGGPIARNKTFFFVNNEWFSRRLTNASTIQTLRPDEKARAVPAVAPLAAMYPDPNVPGTNLFRSAVASSVDQFSMVARVDHELNDKHRVFWRTTLLSSTNRGVAGAAFSRYSSNIGPTGHSFQHQWSPTARSLNEARLNYTRFKILDDFLDPVALGDPSRNGLVGTVAVNGLSSLGQFAFMARRTGQNNYQWTDDFSHTAGAHSFKTGVAIRRLQLNNGTFAPSFTGILRFNNVNDFLAGRAASYSRNLGNPYIGLRAVEYNGYAQDDWRALPRLTLNFGVRYELNTVPNEVNGLIAERYRFRGDHNNVAPRFGLALRADRDGKTVIRGGYGLYYNVLELSFIGLTRFNPPLVASFSNAMPSFPDLLAGGRQGIPSGLVEPNQNSRLPYSQHLNLAMERQLWNPRTTLTIAYVGTLGRKLPRVSRPNGGDGLAPAQRPDPTIGVVNALETAATSSYHGAQLGFQTSGRGMTLRGSYTYSKFIDEVSDFPSSNQGIDRGLLALDERNWRLNRGRSDLDMRHVASLAWIYELPFARGHRWIGGWQVQGIATVNSGRPYTLYSGTDAPDGSNNNRLLDVPGSLVRFGGSSQRTIGIAPGFTAAQLTPARGAFGTLGRNTEYGDGLTALNASLFKDFAFTERWKLQFRAEGFNLFNTVSYALPDGVLSSRNFGQVLSAGDPRQIQLGLRLVF